MRKNSRFPLFDIHIVVSIFLFVQMQNNLLNFLLVVNH